MPVTCPQDVPTGVDETSGRFVSEGVGWMRGGGGARSKCDRKSSRVFNADALCQHPVTNREVNKLSLTNFNQSCRFSNDFTAWNCNLRTCFRNEAMHRKTAVTKQQYMSENVATIHVWFRIPVLDSKRRNRRVVMATGKEINRLNIEFYAGKLSPFCKGKNITAHFREAPYHPDIL